METTKYSTKGGDEMIKTQHIDTKLLDSYIERSGLKISFIVDNIGISRQAFDRKRKGIISFKGSEVYVLCDLCKIPANDRENIFFPQNVTKMETEEGEPQ